MQTRTIEFSINAIKAMNKYLKDQSVDSLIDAGLSEEEREALFDAYGMFREEVEEIEIDEAYQEDLNNG